MCILVDSHIYLSILFLVSSVHEISREESATKHFNMVAQLHFVQKDVPIIDVHYHYFAPHILGPMGEFVIADPDETPQAMAKLVSLAVFERKVASYPC